MSGALSAGYSLISDVLFGICIFQVSADLCNLWRATTSVALENAPYEWL